MPERDKGGPSGDGTLGESGLLQIQGLAETMLGELTLEAGDDDYVEPPAGLEDVIIISNDGVRRVIEPEDSTVDTIFGEEESEPSLETVGVDEGSGLLDTSGDEVDFLVETIETPDPTQLTAAKERRASHLIALLAERLDSFATGMGIKRQSYELFAILRDYRKDILVEIIETCLCCEGSPIHDDFIKSLKLKAELQFILFENKGLADRLRKVYRQVNLKSADTIVSNNDLAKWFSDDYNFALFLGEIMKLRRVLVD